MYRAAQNRTEVIPVQGTWIGIISSVKEHMQDHRVEIDSGDIMLLFSDGITEAFNEKGEMFYPEQLETEREKVENILLNTAKKCVEEDFAEVILLACGVFEWIALDLGKKLGVSIVPPNLAGLKIAELLVDLNRKAGLGLSKIGAFYIPPERLEGIEAELRK